MDPWDLYKQAYARIEKQAAPVVDKLLRSGWVLRPGAWALSSVMRARALGDAALEVMWSTLRVPTRTEQERLLDVLSRIDGRLSALEQREH